MKTLNKIALACIPFMGLAACGGGGDLQDRLDVADPAVRFVDAAPYAPNLTLYEGTPPVAQSNATNVPYEGASNYFDVGTGNATWTVSTATGNVSVGSVAIDPQRGTKDTILAYSTSTTATGVALILDPYNKPLNSTSTRVRLFNGSLALQ